MEHSFSFVAGNGGAGGTDGSVNVHVTASNHIYGEGSSSSAVLWSLPRAHSAGYDSGRKDLPSPCLEGTRVGILKDIMSWLKSTDDSTPHVYWLNGIAGIGKSTIARTIAEGAQSEGMLGATFFFSRSNQSLSDPQTLFPTLAFQLANADDAFKTAIVEALERDPGVAYKSLLPQLEGLILAPLLTIDRNRRTTLIVLDAMDECEESGAEDILRYLFSHATQIPFLRILITGRPEPHISSVFNEGPNHAKTVLHDIEASVVQRDIRLYIYAELEKIARKFRPKTADWATEADVDSLVERSGKLFIYAATCIRFIGDGGVRDPGIHLRLVLNTQIAAQSRATLYRQLDSLYMGILRNSLSDSDPEVIGERFQAVVGSIVLLREPLPLLSLARFVQYETEIVDATLYHLHSIIIPPSNIHEAPRVYHPSFLDFITDPRRCSLPDFVIVPIPDQERRHAIRCFELMAAYLKRDMVEISDPSLLNSEVDGLEEKVSNALPPEAQYACKFWASHLSRVEFGDQTVVDALERFSMRSILWWLEAMSLIGSSFTAVGCIQEAHRWAVGSKCQATIVTMLSDTSRFILAHAQVIRESALHVYFSALPFTPHDTALYKTYHRESDDSVNVLQGVESQWPRILGIFLGHSGWVKSVAFSPDGLRLASGSSDISIRLWEATSGKAIASLEGHSGWVWSVTFSPDGSRLASGSHDHSVRLWDIASGKLIASLEGHAGGVTSVTFSQDGLWLASGSYDHSVWLWDARSGEPITSLKGHSDTVTSVAFSPDSLWLASGSSDYSIRLWDPTSGKLIASLEGHSGGVASVAFSPDGLRLASGSCDRSVQLWDVTSGKPIVSCEGHSAGVTSISFSPDGMRLASGSYDNSVRLWDATLGKPIASLEGHSDRVASVAFSPDGLRLASGSDDHSIRLWGATSGKPVTSLERHSDIVTSVAFSPDGLRLASGSEDCSVRLWDATSGMPIASLKGHCGRIVCIAFSRDGLRLASGSGDHSVRLWDAMSGEPIASLEGHSDHVISVAFSAEGHTLISQTEKVTFAWDLSSPPPFRIASKSHPVPRPSTVGPHSLIWSYHGQRLQVWGLPGNHVRHICWIPALYSPNSMVQVTSLPTQSRIAVGCTDGRVIILHIQHHPFGI